MKYLITVIFVLFSNIGNATDKFTGRGTITLPNNDIGHFTIDIDIDSKKNVSGSYQYTRVKQPIKLTGSINGDEVRLFAQEFSETIVAKIQYQDSFIQEINGQWKSPTTSGKIHAISDPRSLGFCTNYNGCSKELIEQLRDRVTVTGNNQFCNSILNSYLEYPDFNQSKGYKVDRIGSGDKAKGVTSGHLSIDINNDGKEEKLIKLSMYSGSRSGCDQEYFQQTNDDVNSILNNELNSHLKPTSCNFYSMPFKYQGKYYISNRAARKNSTDLQIDYDLINQLFLNLLSEVYVIDNNNLSTVCSYSYSAPNEKN